MATINQLNVNGTLYDINDKRITIESNTTEMSFGRQDSINDAWINVKGSNGTIGSAHFYNDKIGYLVYDGSNWVTKYTITSQAGLPYCSVYYAGSGDTTFSSPPVIWNTINRDTHNAYSTSTGIYTVPIAGIYLVSVNYYSNSPGNTARPRVFHTNSAGSIIADSSQLNGQSAVSVTGIFYCEVGDRLYFGPQASNWPLSIYAAAHHNCMNIACLRPL